MKIYRSKVKVQQVMTQILYLKTIFFKNFTIFLDQYAIGDLSGKFCSLSYPSTINSNYKSDGITPIKSLNLYSTDYNLPLFGKNSIIGRALVFYDLEGNAVR